jgi:hypothetical protein
VRDDDANDALGVLGDLRGSSMANTGSTQRIKQGCVWVVSVGVDWRVLLHTYAVNSDD